MGYSPWGCKESDMPERAYTHNVFYCQITNGEAGAPGVCRFCKVAQLVEKRPRFVLGIEREDLCALASPLCAHSDPVDRLLAAIIHFLRGVGAISSVSSRTQNSGSEPSVGGL